MAGDVTFTLTGDAELDRKFKELPIKLEKKILREALRPAAKMIMESERALAPDITGTVRGSLKVRAGKRSRKTPNSVTLLVQTSAADFRGPEFYSAFLDLGHRIGSRKLGDKRRLIAGAGFMQKGLAQVAEAAKQDAIQRIKDGIEREASAGS